MGDVWPRLKHLCPTLEQEFVNALRPRGSARRGYNVRLGRTCLLHDADVYIEVIKAPPRPLPV